MLEIGIEGHGPIHFVAAVLAFEILLCDNQHMDIGMILGDIHLTDDGYTGLETFAVDQHFCPTRFQTGREAVPNPLAITVPVADKDPRHSTAPAVTMEISLLFRLVIATRMRADLRMIPHESALFQSVYTDPAETSPIQPQRERL
ncbi:MAG TPA: hypothetical protein VKK81_25920 [Candidatus Binatia bacterium]|nr:hypothetical protein [Candidatus Binatia bacterium]